MKNDFDKINDYHSLIYYIRQNCKHRTGGIFGNICGRNNEQCRVLLECIDYNNFDNKRFTKLYNIVRVNQRTGKLNNLINKIKDNENTD